MNRMAAVVLGWLILSTGAYAGPAAPVQKEDQLQHKWKVAREDGEFTLVSKYPAPVPFGTHGEPEATLAMTAEAVPPGMDTLEKVVASEIGDIRQQLHIADYAQEDGQKPVQGIATWYETIDGTRVAFIKYRADGIVGKDRVLPLTAIHSVVVRGDRIFFTHLIVRFAGHQDEVRHDQRFLIRKEITAPLGERAQGQ